LKRFLATSILFACIQGCAKGPDRPANIPPSAVKVDGAFVECSIESASHANRCTAYKDNGGDVLISGLFVLSGAGREAATEDLKFVGFDGTRIYLADGRTLYPVRVEESAVMEGRLRQLAGDGAVDCGRGKANVSVTAAANCVRSALADKKPFYIRYVSDIDNSVLAEGIAGDSRAEIYEIRYVSTRWSASERPRGAQLSDGGYILTQACPKPVRMWGALNERLTCFPPIE
jgi:hypothetical protein